MSAFYRCFSNCVSVVCVHLSVIVWYGYFLFKMSDMSENRLGLFDRVCGSGREAGTVVVRVLAVIFFVIAAGIFLTGFFFWLQKKQASRNSDEATRIVVTPEILDKGMTATLKDNLEYCFWPPYHVPPMERQDLLRTCLQEAQKYLSTPGLVQKSSYVWKPLKSLPLMVRHYAVTSPELIVSRPTGPKRFAVSKVEGVPCVQLLIGFEKTPDMEFCFFKDEQEGGWKLDWQQFARYQPLNWDDFVHGKGEDLAEFRIWMIRDRMSENKDDYAFKMIAPGANGSEERSIARPLVYVPKKTEMGKRLFMLFKMNEKMERSSYRVLNANDELDMLRVRVLLSRSSKPDRKGEYSFTLVKLLGEGWYGLSFSE